jgi:hypothetical protein
VSREKRARCYHAKLPNGAEVRIHAKEPPSPETLEALMEVMTAAYEELRDERMFDYDLGGEG